MRANISTTAPAAARSCGRGAVIAVSSVPMVIFRAHRSSLRLSGRTAAAELRNAKIFRKSDRRVMLDALPLNSLLILWFHPRAPTRRTPVIRIPCRAHRRYFRGPPCISQSVRARPIRAASSSGIAIFLNALTFARPLLPIGRRSESEPNGARNRRNACPAASPQSLWDAA